MDASVVVVEEEEDICATVPPDAARIWTVGVVGSAVATLSACLNAFLFVVLARNRKHRTTHVLYLTLLALFDAFLSAAYVLLFSVNVAMDAWESSWLAAAWWTYMRPVLTISHVAISISAYLIVAAACERYITITGHRRSFFRRHRASVALGAILLAVVAKLPIYFEIEVIKNGDCQGVTEWTARQAAFGETEPYASVYKFWFRNIVTIFLPFVFCFYFNIGIITRLRRQHKAAKMFRFATSEHRSNIRAASLTLFLVSLTYLASNVLNVFINTWEVIDRASLLTDAYRPFYTFTTDLVSVLTVVSSCLRLPIYMTCNRAMCTEVLDSLHTVRRSIRFPRKPTMAVELIPNAGESCARKISENRVSSQLNGGYVLAFEPPARPRKSMCLGTDFDRMVLSVALHGIDRKSSAASITSQAPQSDDTCK